MRRFFVAPQLLRQNPAIITGELCHYLATVLRLKAGDDILLADGTGLEAVARISAVAKDSISVAIESINSALPADKAISITLFQGLPKGEKLDHILQKCTELGVARIVPFMAERSIAKLAAERLDKRLQRWERIVLEAARQSGRSTIPTIGFADNLKTALLSDRSALRLLLWEGELEQGLRQLLEHCGEVATASVIIGPEGGLTKAEAAAATAAGFTPITLGKRILRTETAGPAVAAILQYVLGDMG